MNTKPVQVVMDFPGWSSHIYEEDFRQRFLHYLTSPSTEPIFYRGDALVVLSSLPDESIDCYMTSPPYWGQRQYDQLGIGLEGAYEEYIEKLARIFQEAKRTLKSAGSLWLNIGDRYVSKGLAGMPWRLALHLIDKQGWILRNEVIWNKLKGAPDNSPDKLRTVHEHLFHFVKTKYFYYNIDDIRSRPRAAKVVNGVVVSATGVKGVKYKRQIELSTALSEAEKKEALLALNTMLEEIATGKLADFRMIIRGRQRVTHSDSERVSGRAKELANRGFYFLRYHPKGSKPDDVWDIIPEDTQQREKHFAPYPEDLCKIPIIATCPPSGIVVDPFCGTGTTMVVARQLQRKSLGIDLSATYLEHAMKRCWGT